MIWQRRIQAHGVAAALEALDGIASDIEFSFKRPSDGPFILDLKLSQIDCIRTDLATNSAAISGRVKCDDREVRLVFVESGSTGIRGGGRKVFEGGMGDCLVYSERLEGDDIRISENCVRLVIRIPKRLICDVISRHFHVEPPKSIGLATLLPRGHPYSGLLRNLVQCSLTSVADTEGRFAAKLAKQSADLIVTSLLSNVPNSLADTLAKASCVAGTRYVKRALEFMRVNLEETIDIDDIAQRANCSPRRLQMAFRAEFGASPTCMLKRMRLELAERRLRTGEHTNVAELAQSLGFGNAGRFAGEFRRQFGVLPSQILQLTSIALLD